MDKISIIFILFFLFVVSNGFSQTSYSFKIETGFLNSRYHYVDIDPGPNWQGYYLNGENGIDLNIINGINYKDKFLVGLGLGYLNFEGINGISVFSDFEYLPIKTRIGPLIYMKAGYSHLWNQYENGTGDGLVEIGAGLNFRLSSDIHIYIKSGFMMTQQSTIIPFRLGFKL
ncbi:hypothetical protein [Anditalea andensis]|uniref:Outer membrane protein beta-barrel domain-containing protein n=1 Tax=Anditalea andensis TaxID=1048983 RepID=A0A074L5U3_9BACT|nr:hypothetical protein [Anditalea andensis]KEO75188.1 hypothetical protein EL17_05840 [Anditalea andensis]